MEKVITFLNGFCMALADSVPGVSGGTIAFLMGFYDKFIGSLDAVVSGNMKQKRNSLTYLLKLGIGWIAGFILAVIVLSSLFERYIYNVSSLFIGFIIFAIPIVINEEKECLKSRKGMIFFVLIGIAIVSAITYFNPVNADNIFSLSSPNPFMYLYVFVTGAIAICAMILPGISGSTLLLIFGIYLPIIKSIREVLSFNLQPLPILAAFLLGVLIGIVSIIKIIKIFLERHRAAAIYLIIGLMIGSLYAIVMGPTTLDNPQPQLTTKTFSIMFFMIGGAVIMWLQLLKKMAEED